MARARSPLNPFAQRQPKPKVLHLIKLPNARQRANYRRLSRSFKRLAGVHADLHYYGTSWGWALRYRRGDEQLCTLHFLPSRLDATVTLSRSLYDWALGPNHISTLTKRDLLSLKRDASPKMLTLPLGSAKRTTDLIKVVRFKVSARHRPLPKSTG